MTEQADPRVLFAAERTLLAWIRTGIAMMGFGFVVARLGLFLHEIGGSEEVMPASGGLSMWVGTVLVVLGAGLNLIGAIEYGQIMRRLRRNITEVPERPIMFAIGVAVLLALVGLAGAVYLLTVRT